MSSLPIGLSCLSATDADIILECLILAPDNSTILRKQIKFDSSFDGCGFNASRETRIITHGWNSNEQSLIYAVTPIEYYKLNKYNVIVTNWLSLSKNLYNLAYGSCITKVASKITNFIVFAKNYANLDISKVTCVGHSLGAHISGYVGKSLKAINPNFILGRILGLDPAGPLFGVVNQVVSSVLDLDFYRQKLSKGDAIFVTCWHTNNLIFGSNYLPNCDMDVVFDGGVFQSHCVKELLDPTCSHGASVEYLTNSLTYPYCYKGYPMLLFNLGIKSTLVFLGEPIQNMYNARGLYTAFTTIDQPFCSL